MHQVKQWFSKLSQTGRFMVILAVLVGVITIIPKSSAEEGQDTVQQASVAPTVKKPEVATKTEIKTETIPHDSRIEDDGNLEKGTTQVKIAGVDGEKTITHTITLTDGVETDRRMTEDVTKAPVTEVMAVGTYVKPAPAPAPTPQPAVSACDPNYSGCVPNVSYDLDCPDIGFMVQVLGYDKHRFDRDRDGYGCENY